MKTNLTLFLSVVALALALASFVARARTRTATSPTPPPARLTPPPTAEAEGGCEAAKDTDSLRGLMRHGINATMTNLSFELHHQPKPDRLERAAAQSMALLRCIRRAATMHGDVGLDGLPEYFRFLNNLQEDTLAVNVSALEGDDEGARHWFRHLKQDCVACHSRFRVETDAAPTVSGK